MLYSSGLRWGGGGGVPEELIFGEASLLEFSVEDQSDKGLTLETTACESLSTPHQRSTTVSFLVAQAVLETEIL